MTDDTVLVGSPRAVGDPGPGRVYVYQRSGSTWTLAATLSGIYPDRNTVTYLVTDGIPADLAALTAADEIDGEARHLVTLVEPTVSQLRSPRVAVPVTSVAPTRPGSRGSR